MQAAANKLLEQIPPQYAVRPPRLLDQVRDLIRVKHYSIRTEKAYVDWVRRYVHFSGMRHPRERGAAEVEAFLTHLATQRQVAASTQNQARSALLFLYKEVLHCELPWLDGVETAKRPARLPVVLTEDEARRVLDGTRGTSGLVLRLLYGTGMRILECLRLRVKDVEFARREIVVREGKGLRDRVTMLPESSATNSPAICGASSWCTSGISLMDTGRFTCLSRLLASIRARLRNGDGNTYLRRIVFRWIHAAE
jgi:integrase